MPNGAVLYQSARQMPEFSVSGDRVRVEDCRKIGVRTWKVGIFGECSWHAPWGFKCIARAISGDLRFVLARAA